MQANCPSCSQRISIDDAKVPDRAFTVKCPKCQNPVRFAGRSAAEGPAESAPGPTMESTLSSISDEMRAELMAQMKKAMSDNGAAGARILVALHDRAVAASVTQPFTKNGFHVDVLDNPDEGARLLEQGVYDMVLTSRTSAVAGQESLTDRINRMSPDARRRIFLVLIGDEYKSGDGTQAFTLLADLVLNPKDLGRAEMIIASTHAERTRLYQSFMDARRRFEAAAS